MDKFESAFKKLKKQVRENEKKKGKYYIFFTNEQLKNFFGFTDKELKTKTKKLKKETLVVDI